MGLESTPGEYVEALVGVFREVRRVLTDDGTVFLNLGDSYCGAPKGSDNGWDKSGLTKPVDGRERSAQIAQRASLRVKDAGSKQATNASADGVRRNRYFPGLKAKDLIGLPWRVAFALQADGWYLRSDIIWHKPNPMPESVTDRPTKSHEYLFLLAKSERYYYDADAIAEDVADSTGPRAMRAQESDARLNGVPGQEPHALHAKRDSWNGSTFTRGKTAEHQEGRSQSEESRMKRSGNTQRKPATERGCPVDGVAGSVPWEGTTRNKRTVWTVNTQPFKEAHFATFPPALIEPCVLAGSAKGDTVLDPFGGAGTTGLVADRLGRHAVLIELNPVYATMAERRISSDNPLFADVSSAGAPTPEQETP